MTRRRAQRVGVITEPPQETTYLVVGSGAGGAPAAAQLAEATGENVVLVEAGPDYGPYSRASWPPELLDARTLPLSHDWGYNSEQQFADRTIAFERARVLGGCTAHNGAIQVRGHRRDYDHWVELGNPGWDTESMLELFLAAEKRLGVWTYPHDELTPYQRTFLDAAPTAGLPQLDTINDLDEDEGAAPETVNVRDGVRWNTAFAYLDPLRDTHPNLTICGDILVDSISVKGSRAIAVNAETPTGRRRIHAENVVLAAGAYGTPAILQRSGVGPPQVLERAGIKPLIDSPVGENLHDQAFISLEFTGSGELVRQMNDFESRRGWAADEQVLIKARSAMIDEAFDLHVFPWSPPGEDGSRRWFLGGACLTPRSRGTLRIQSTDPHRQPGIDNAFLCDPAGHDLGALRSLFALFRELAAAPAAQQLLGSEIGPSENVRTADEITSFIRNTVGHYWHPQGTCRMGPDADPGAVCTPRGQVRGFDNVYVADCSLIPEAPRGFPMLPTIAIAQKVTGWLIGAAHGP